MDIRPAARSKPGKRLPKAGTELAAEEVIAWCRQHLAGFKVPRSIVFGELPKTSTGKIQKFVLRERARSTAAIE